MCLRSYSQSKDLLTTILFFYPAISNHSIINGNINNENEIYWYSGVNDFILNILKNVSAISI